MFAIGCLDVHKVFNVTGYIPALSSVTGILRMLMGAVEAVAGAIFSLISCFEASNVWFAIGGVQDIVRGAIETIPLVGNLATGVYDLFLFLFGSYT